MKPLNIFYEEPDRDRWVPYDRVVRRFIRRVLRGKSRPGGQMMVAINLLKGLDKLKIPYRFNDYAYIRKNPNELACVIGKTFVLDKMKWKNPILFGASVFSHPFEEPELLEKHSEIRKILVPGQWMRDMFEPYYPGKVVSWPVGIDTEEWSPNLKQDPEFDFLIYDKVRWNYDTLNDTLIGRIKDTLAANGMTYNTIRYMHYQPEELKEKVAKCRYCIFLVEHETQGLAYQQILSSGTPIIAWDQRKHWLDPQYFPNKVKFGPVSAVPYWNDECGCKFEDINDFEKTLAEFRQKAALNYFNPRNYIINNLTLEKQALEYAKIAQAIIDDEK